MTAVCPSCGAEQSQSLLCHTCTSRLERALGDVASIVADLDVTLSKQARIGAGGSGGLARERSPIDVGAMTAGDNLANVLTTWARDVASEDVAWLTVQLDRTAASARLLLRRIDAIRRHPAVDEMVDEIGDAISQARRVVDRPADRIYLGQCLFEEGDVTCYSEIWASPTASAVQCKVCGVTHPVTERRAWLLERASDMLFTVSQAAQMIGDVGGKRITEDRIRGYLRRNRLTWRPIGKDRGIRLGDLLDIVATEDEKKSA